MRRVIALGLLAAVVAGCAPGGGPILANPPAPRPSIPPPTEPPAAVKDPLPVELPRDDGPHDRLTEWWYYTGHLIGQTPGGDDTRHRFGFEYVIFRAERGAFPTTWASHLAITDETGEAFHYAQRLQVGATVDRSPRGPDGVPTGFDLALTGVDPTDPSTLGRPAWSMAGSAGTDRLDASIEASEAASQRTVPMGLGLHLTARKPAALHDRDGWIDFGPGGGSYYYSRTDMTAAGTLSLGDVTYQVDGSAWFDHQWGDFISVGGGGWDWFAVNLDDGTDLTLSLVRDADGSYPLIYGTRVRPNGATEHLDRSAFTVDVTRTWTSPRTGATYPAGWAIRLPRDELTIELAPTVAAQELDTRATTGVIYWEGSQAVTAHVGAGRGRDLGGEAYVELTGYAGGGIAPGAAAPSPSAP
jgi:predicted secreted hydrolase